MNVIPEKTIKVEKIIGIEPSAIATPIVLIKKT
jgi:hypothetical protein